MKEIAKSRYCISSQIDPIIDYVMSVPDTKIDLKKYAAIIDQYYFLVRTVLHSSKKIKRLKKMNNTNRKSFIKQIFSIENEYIHGSKHKIIRILGIKFKIKMKNNQTS